MWCYVYITPCFNIQICIMHVAMYAQGCMQQGGDKVVTWWWQGGHKVVTRWRQFQNTRLSPPTYKVVTRWLPQGCYMVVTTLLLGQVDLSSYQAGIPQNVRILGSHEGYLPEYLLSCTTVLLAPGQFALKLSLLTSYTGDTFTAKHFHRRLNQPSVFILATHSHMTKHIVFYAHARDKPWPGTYVPKPSP